MHFISLLRCRPLSLTSLSLPPIGYAAADQVVLSASNFVITIALANGLGPHQFGIFATYFSVIYLLHGVQATLVTQPHNVLSQSWTSENYRRLSSGVLVFQTLVSLACAALFVTLALLVSVWFGYSQPELPLFVILMIIWQFQEWFRKMLYSKFRFRVAFLNDLASFGTQTALIVTLWYLNVLTIHRVLTVMVICYSFGALLGLLKNSGDLSVRGDLNAIEMCWHFGKWLLAGNLGYWMAFQFYLLLTTLIAGPAATALVRSAQVFGGPLTVLGNFLDSYLLVRVSRVHYELGRSSVISSIKLASKRTVPIATIYCGIIFLAAPHLVRSLFGPGYEDAISVLRILSFAWMVTFLYRLVSIALRALELTRRVFGAFFVASVTAVILSYPLIITLGANGASVGILFSAVLVFWLQFYSLRSAKP